MFCDNVFVRKDFLSTTMKRVIENKPGFGGTQGKAYSSQDFRDMENLKLLMHLVHIYEFSIISRHKINL